MNRWKLNKSLWFSLGLTCLLCVAFLVIASGTALARYRTEREAKITFEVREPEQISLGMVRTITKEEATAQLPAGTEVFDPSGEPAWQTVDGVPQLTLAAANGISDTEFAEYDQSIRLRLIGSLGLWTGADTAQIFLLMEDGTKLQATATPIVEGTAMYVSHGEGWVYSFLDAEGEELTRNLAGGKLSYTSFTVTIENTSLTDTVLLQPMVIGEAISE